MSSKLDIETERLILDNQGLVYYIVRNLNLSRSSSIYEDLLSIGQIGLIKAAKTFDSSKNIHFIDNNINTTLTPNVIFDDKSPVIRAFTISVTTSKSIQLNTNKLNITDNNNIINEYTINVNLSKNFILLLPLLL